MSKYPIFIVSKGRADICLTAKMFDEDNVFYRVLVEPQEFDEYAKYIDKSKLYKLPFSNLGLGSYPARKQARLIAKKENAEFYWCFDDNIRGACKLIKGSKVPCTSSLAISRAETLNDSYKNVAITAFNYRYLIGPEAKKAFYINVHAYSCMLIKVNMPFDWRLKYNEDVDLCLQVLDNKQCTILINVYLMNKTSTSAKMRGGNQTELYKNNDTKMKIIKTDSLRKIWPQYVSLTYKYGRPHHFVDWKKHFTHSLIRKT